ncbi:hypothetical protein IW262DRAFT_1451369 [Armillaria fumosa]|nr:hypothetical protein IW262DRAFT_1451369 [Armillaria fumosa]
MVVNDDTDRIPSPVQDNTSQMSMDVKGKKKASEEEVLHMVMENDEYRAKVKQHNIEEEPIPPEVLEIAHRIHGQDRIGDLEQQLQQAHGSLASALQCNQQLKQELEQSNRGVKWSLSCGEPSMENSNNKCHS